MGQALSVVLEESQKEKIVQLSSGCNAISPEILPYEIGNALPAMMKRKKITKNEALLAHKKISITILE